VPKAGVRLFVIKRQKITYCGNCTFRDRGQLWAKGGAVSWAVIHD